ncbi:MAG: AIR synthase family protein [Clostridia bacterium]|nr:AIR synthase family protein [Clostridia bacterium]
MKVGKLSTDKLNRLIHGNTGATREEVVIRPKIGEDCAVIRFGDEGCILSTDPITGSASEIGKLAVHINGNDIASSGGEIIGLMLTILAPEGTTLEALEYIMQQASDEAKALDIEIIGGHTEITRAVNQILVSATAVGKEKLDKIVATGGGQVGDHILITKGVGIEGTGIIAYEKSDELSQILTADELRAAQDMLNWVSVYKEGRIAGAFGVTSMHDVTEGGIMGALWESCTAAEIGCRVRLAHMPVAAVTEKICAHFNIDPYRLISSGSMMITVAAEQVDALIKKLEAEQILTFDIGVLTEGDMLYVDLEGGVLEIPEPDSDELYQVI